MLIIVWPTAKAMLPDAAPEATSTPFTIIVAPASCAAGVTVADAVELPTDAVYVVVLPTVPVFVSAETGVSAMDANKGLPDGARVTIIT